MSRYLKDAQQSLVANGFVCPLLLMTSGGGLMDADTAVMFPVRLIESGPAGGAILAENVAREAKANEVISLDMGGTTAKICAVSKGRAGITRMFEVDRAQLFMKHSGLPLQIPCIDLVEISGGGGSIASIDAVGNLRVTDADLVLGRLEAGSLALGEVDLKLCKAKAAMSTLAGHLKVSTEVAADSVAEAVEDSLVTAAQAHAVEHGLDLPRHVLVAFGGAAPLRAARLAERLGIQTVLIPPDASVGSAIGFFSAPLAFEAIESCTMTFSNFDHSKINGIFRQLWHKTVSVVAAGAARWKPGRPPRERRRAYMRYIGQGHEVCVDLANRDLEPADPKKLREDFENEYIRLGFIPLPTEELEFRAFALEVVADADPLTWPRERLRAKQKVEGSMLHSGGEGALAKSNTARLIYDKGQVEMVEHLVYSRSDLKVGDFVRGPAVICEAFTTTIFPESFDCWVLENGFLQLQARGSLAKPGTNLSFHKALSWSDAKSPEQRSLQCIGYRLLWTRLLAMVEEQARTTLRNSFSMLLRECRAVTCAVLSRSGDLLAQSEISSPSLMGVLLEVQMSIERVQKLCKGECMVQITAGCMPRHSDLIVLTPVFEGDSTHPCGYVTSVAHIRTMPCLSRVVNRETLRELGEKSTDIAALLASNELGLRRLLTLLDDRSATMTSLGAYILKESREAVMRNLPCKDVILSQKRTVILERTGETKEAHVVDLAAEISSLKTGLKVKLFAHCTDGQALKGSPALLCTSFCKFSLMVLFGQGIPVNSGSLDAFDIEIPADSILDALPGDVVGSQLAYFLPDLLFDCLVSVADCPADSAAALSSLCWKTEEDSSCSTFGFHIESGGMGAQASNDGRNCCIFPCGFQSVPMEMTEASSSAMLFGCKELITDSGGAGSFRGGLGVRLELMAQQRVQVLSIQGGPIDGPRGRDGAFSGKVFSKRKQDRDKQETSKLYEQGEGLLHPGDTLILETPGGGGFGPPSKRCRESLLHDVEEGYVSQAAAVQLYKLDLQKK
eukprot:Skav228211  [mRNA]  locus=scaffold5334:4059:7362:- [translate_table: standard]